MKIFGFNDNGLSTCEDTRYLSDKELLSKLKTQDTYLEKSINNKYEEMETLAKLSKSYEYSDSIRSMVGVCFMEIDSLRQSKRELKNKIKTIKGRK